MDLIDWFYICSVIREEKKEKNIWARQTLALDRRNPRAMATLAGCVKNHHKTACLKLCFWFQGIQGNTFTGICVKRPQTKSIGQSLYSVYTLSWCSCNLRKETPTARLRVCFFQAAKDFNGCDAKSMDIQPERLPANWAKQPFGNHWRRCYVHVHWQRAESQLKAFAANN